MLSWIMNNLGTIIVTIILIVIVALIIRTLMNDKKQGRSSCGSNCSHCAMSGSCHQRIDHRPETTSMAFVRKNRL